MTWFRQLTGFEEATPGVIRERLHLHGESLVCSIHDARYQFGRLEIPSLAELRNLAADVNKTSSRIAVREVVADVQDLHCDVANSGALFQVASQFNLLEMVSPNVTPEDGVGIYEHDRTQGPACAIACGAGTIYRNYFVPVNGQIGQTAANQIDCLADIGSCLGNTNSQLWQMKNGTVWEPFARLVLEAAYEATLCAAVLNAHRSGNKTVYLTLLGGGACWQHDRLDHRRHSPCVGSLSKRRSECCHCQLRLIERLCSPAGKRILSVSEADRCFVNVGLSDRRSACSGRPYRLEPRPFGSRISKHSVNLLISRCVSLSNLLANASLTSFKFGASVPCVSYGQASYTSPWIQGAMSIIRPVPIMERSSPPRFCAVDAWPYSEMNS